MTRAEIIFGSDCPNLESGRENSRSALLPRLICPACWPTYARLISSMGLGSVKYTSYLGPLKILFLILVLPYLSHRAKARQGHRPVLMRIWGAGVVVVGKFVLLCNLFMYGGTGVLMAASFWSS